MIGVWLKFIILLILVYIFGSRVTKSSDIIAEKKGWGRAFMGVVFISMVTSFPELFTGISAASIVKSPEISLGQIAGSCIFNLTIIALVQIFFRKNSLFENNSKNDLFPLLFSFLLIVLFSSALLISFRVRILNVGISSLMIFAIYVVFLHHIFKNRKTGSEEKNYKNEKLSNAVVSFAISSLIIIAVGFYLPVVGKELALKMGWTDSFVGVIFLAFVTSFPELIVSITAARIGAFEMLLGNIAGSNLFNIGIVFIIDIFYFSGDIIADITDSNIFYIGIIAAFMNLILFFTLFRGKVVRTIFKIPLNSILILILYILSLGIIY
ncbi:MAG: hypothetical protein ABFR36_08280 [Acidobacteriota bacterium]